MNIPCKEELSDTETINIQIKEFEKAVNLCLENVE